MVVSIVMAIFFQEQSQSGELAGPFSIEGLLPAWCQQASARPPKSDEHRTRLRERSNKETLRRTADGISLLAMQGAQRVRPPFGRPRDP
jgi:hypothetical protein